MEVRLSLPALRQGPAGPRQLTFAGYRRCNSIRIGIAADAKQKTCRCVRIEGD
jgi:hypothetical protein